MTVHELDSLHGALLKLSQNTQQKYNHDFNPEVSAKKSYRTLIILTITFLIVSIGFGMFQFFFSRAPDKYVTTTVDTLNIPTIQLSGNMTLSQVAITSGEINGVIKNNGDKKLKIFDVNFLFYNSSKFIQKINCSVNQTISPGEEMEIKGDSTSLSQSYNSVEIKVDFH